MANSIQVILRDDVSSLGDIGDLVTVKSGYYRNYLFPRGLAIEANARQLNRFDHEKRIIERRISRARGAAELQRNKLDDLGLTVAKAVGENDKLFGSVTTMEIEALLREEGFEISRRQIMLDGPIKSTGVFPVSVKLHRDVVATIKIYVVAKQAS